MKINLSFKEYLESKERLKSACDNIPIVKHVYEVRKYCKVPLQENTDNDNKKYISLKPKDIIEILWEYENVDSPTPINICIGSDDENIMYFSWSDAKVRKWASTTISKI